MVTFMRTYITVSEAKTGRKCWKVLRGAKEQHPHTILGFMLTISLKQK